MFVLGLAPKYSKDKHSICHHSCIGMIQTECVILVAVEVGHSGEGVVIAGVLGVEDVGHGDSPVRPIAGSRVNVSCLTLD